MTAELFRRVQTFLRDCPHGVSPLKSGRRKGWVGLTLQRANGLFLRPVDDSLIELWEDDRHCFASFHADGRMQVQIPVYRHPSAFSDRIRAALHKWSEPEIRYGDKPSVYIAPRFQLAAPFNYEQETVRVGAMVYVYTPGFTVDTVTGAVLSPLEPFKRKYLDPMRVKELKDGIVRSGFAAKLPSLLDAAGTRTYELRYEFEKDIASIGYINLLTDARYEGLWQRYVTLEFPSKWITGGWGGRPEETLTCWRHSDKNALAKIIKQVKQAECYVTEPTDITSMVLTT